MKKAKRRRVASAMRPEGATPDNEERAVFGDLWGTPELDLVTAWRGVARRATDKGSGAPVIDLNAVSRRLALGTAARVVDAIANGDAAFFDRLSEALRWYLSHENEDGSVEPEDRARQYAVTLLRITGTAPTARELVEMVGLFNYAIEERTAHNILKEIRAEES